MSLECFRSEISCDYDVPLCVPPIVRTMDLQHIDSFGAGDLVTKITISYFIILALQK